MPVIPALRVGYLFKSILGYIVSLSLYVWMYDVCIFVCMHTFCMYPVSMFCYLCVCMMYVYTLSLLCHLCVCMMCICIYVMYACMYVCISIYIYDGECVESRRQPQLLVPTFHLVWDTRLAHPPASRYFPVSITHHHIWALRIETYTAACLSFTCVLEIHIQIIIFMQQALYPLS